MRTRIQRYHREILQAIRQQAGPSEPHPGDSYVGTSKPVYGMSTPAARRIARGWAERHRGLTPEEYAALLDSLAKGQSNNEFGFIGHLLGLYPHLRRSLAPNRLDGWLACAKGWAEVDCICQSSFTADELLGRWREWKSVLVRFSRDANVHKRRASLVLLTKPVRKSPDPRLARLAFANIERLKAEKHILITKAISWLLRDLTYQHRAEVEAYLKAQEPTLPRIAVRETRAKLETGRKTKRRVPLKNKNAG